MESVISEYINGFEGIAKQRLIEIREIISNIVPEASERISYQMPAFYQNGILVYFAAQKHHLGFYPLIEAIAHFSDRLIKYKHSKGAVQFSYQHPLPKELIEDIVKYRVSKNTV